jgi:hypothetical protein
MCPERNLLSAYFDGELDHRFGVEVEAHVAECDECAEFLNELGGIHSALMVPDAYQDSVDTLLAWDVLQQRIAVAIPLPLWKRRFQIPVPILGFATLIVVLLSVGLFLSLNSQRAYKPFDTVTRSELEGSELTSVEAILNYLDARGEREASIFNLPQDTKLHFWSEPTLIRAADYHRGRD